MDDPSGATGWQFVTPQLPVPDVREAQAYYRDVLGFKIAWIYRGGVRRRLPRGDRDLLFTKEEGEIRPCWNFVRVENADAVLAILPRAGRPKIVEEIASHPWGMREFTIEDNNGHLLSDRSQSRGRSSTSDDCECSRAGGRLRDSVRDLTCVNGWWVRPASRESGLTPLKADAV